MSATIEDLAARAIERSEEPGDYWDRAFQFLSGIVDTTVSTRTRKQQNWLVDLRLELTEPGD